MKKLFILAIIHITIMISAVNAQIVSIASVTTQDASGSPVSNGVSTSVTGIVHGVDLRASSSGLLFTIIDNTGGITCFTSPNTYGYTVTEGDSIVIDGTIGQFNGLTQINADTIKYISSGHNLEYPRLVRALGEEEESELVQIKYLTLTTPSQWTGTGSGFNVDVTDGVNTFLMRIDNDVDLYSMSAPTGTFHVTGIGSQYDVSSPYLDWYQILPRYATDITPIPFYDIATVTTENANGVPDSMYTKCMLSGIVYGVNTRASETGVSFTLRDNTGGIICYNGGSDFGYTITEGDSIVVGGNITHFNGLTEIFLDTIFPINAGNTLKSPTSVNTPLDESTEADLIKINNLTLVNPSQWSTGSGSGFAVDMTDGTNTYEAWIDNDCSLFSTTAPTGAFNLTGIGAQYDGTFPFTSGYQIQPRYTADLENIASVPVPSYTIATVTTEDGNGEPDSVNVNCSLTGVVHGVNTRFSETGTSFTIIDATGGIVCYNGSTTFGYTVTEGDEVTVYGTIGQFNGLTQINLDSLTYNSSGNALQATTVITTLDESTESKIVTINNLTLITPSQWTGTGSGFNLDVTDGSNNYVVWVDNDCSLYSGTAPTGAFNLTGLGAQYDQGSPYNTNYQLHPRYAADLVAVTTGGNTASTISVNTCGPYTSPSGNVYTTSNTYIDTIPNAANFDSIITIILSVGSSSTGTLTTSSCDSYTSPSGKVFTTSNTYMDTIPNGSGCDSVITINLTINPTPTVVASGATTTCIGQSTVLSATGAASYSWDNGAGSGSSVTVAPTSTTTYTVTGTSNGCSATDQVTITVSGSTAPTVVATANDTVLCGSGTVILSASGANTYTWDNGLGSGSSVSATVTSTTTFTVTGSNGTCDNTDAITIVVNDNPTPPIVDNNGTFETGVYTTYQWYLNGTAISGATLQTYTYTQPGSYTVEVTDANGCSGTSSEIIILDTYINEGETNIFTITPNPSKYQITINGLQGKFNSNIRIIDITGKEVLKVNGYNNNKSINIQHLQKGVYFVEIFNNDSIYTERFVKY